MKTSEESLPYLGRASVKSRQRSKGDIVGVITLVMFVLVMIWWNQIWKLANAHPLLSFVGVVLVIGGGLTLAISIAERRQLRQERDR